jgi:DNA invertase Pin-like site-specific DNA recombinase
VPDARAIGDNLAGRGIKLSLGGQVYDPADPMGKMFFNILATFAEFEVDLLRMRTREGMAVARAKGKLRQAAQAVRQAAARAGADGRHWRLHDRRPRRAVHRLPRDRVPNPPASPGCRQSQVTSPSRYLALREHRTRTADPGRRPITVTWP